MSEAKRFHTYAPGELVVVKDTTYKLIKPFSIEKFMAEDVVTGKETAVAIEDFKPVPLTRNQAKQPDKDLDDYSEEEKVQAQARLIAIKPLLKPGRTRKQVEAEAKKHDVSTATFYRWIASYEAAGHLSALIGQKVGRKVGEKKLRPDKELAIDEVLDDEVFMKRKRTPAEIIEEVERRCRLARTAPPHGNTIRRRLKNVHPKVLLRRQGRHSEANHLYTALKGIYPDQAFPFQVVMMDHTPLDIELVDEETGQTTGRAWLTLAFCVATRMVAGLYISFDTPNSTSVAACIAHAMCPKRDYLLKLGVPGVWSVWGKMGKIFVDNAKEFRAKALKEGCDEYGMDLQWRPAKQPKFGGHIERMMLVTAEEIHKYCGTTFSNIEKRKGYDSAKEAGLTKQVVEANLVDFFINDYARRKHSALGMTPLQAWELGIMGTDTIKGIGVMPIPGDPERIAIDFMPRFDRTIQRYGVQIEHLEYYDPVLDFWINALDPTDPHKKRKRKFIFRRDQRNARLYFLDPRTNDYVRIPFRDRGKPDLAVWELDRATKELLEQGGKADEQSIWESAERRRARAEASKLKSKAARRDIARTPKPSAAQPAAAAPAAAAPGAPPTDPGEDKALKALFAAPVVPFASRLAK